MRSNSASSAAATTCDHQTRYFKSLNDKNIFVNSDA